MLILTQILCLVLGAISTSLAALFFLMGSVAIYQAFSFTAIVFMAVWLFLRTAQRHYSYRTGQLDEWDEERNEP